MRYLLALAFLCFPCFLNGKSVKVGTASFHGIISPSLEDIVTNEIDVFGKPKIRKRMLSGSFWVYPKDFRTGISLRDDHMFDRFEINKYPKAILKMKPVKMEGSQTFTGSFTLHGVTKPIEGKIKFESDKKASAMFSVNYRDWQFKRAWYEAMELKGRIDINVKLAL
jgi:hypothetical protein